MKHCSRARRRKLHPRGRVRREGQAAPAQEQKCRRTHLFGLYDAWNHDGFHSCRTGFFTALKAAPRVQTTTLSQAVVVNPAPLSDDDDDDGRKRHSPEMPARTPRRTTLLLGPCSAHRRTGMLTPSQFPVWAPSVFLECEKPCPVQGAQNTLARAPRQRHTDFEACALHMITGVGRTAAVDGPCLASRAHERAPAVCPSPRELRSHAHARCPWI